LIQWRTDCCGFHFWVYKVRDRSDGWLLIPGSRISAGLRTNTLPHGA
jgi:hypothetical protein